MRIYCCLYLVGGGVIAVVVRCAATGFETPTCASQSGFEKLAAEKSRPRRAGMAKGHISILWGYMAAVQFAFVPVQRRGRGTVAFGSNSRVRTPPIPLSVHMRAAKEVLVAGDG